MIERDETVYLRHMLDAIDQIARYVDGKSKGDFWGSEMLQDAIVRQLEILGEAAGRVSRETCAAHPEVPWPKITGLRHRLIHDYFDVDGNMVWRVATIDVPEVREKVLAVLLSLEN